MNEVKLELIYYERSNFRQVNLEWEVRRAIIRYLNCNYWQLIHISTAKPTARLPMDELLKSLMLNVNVKLKKLILLSQSLSSCIHWSSYKFCSSKRTLLMSSYGEMEDDADRTNWLWCTVTIISQWMTYINYMLPVTMLSIFHGLRINKICWKADICISTEFSI